jgi:hypothetical protein
MKSCSPAATLAEAERAHCGNLISSIGVRLMSWVITCADYWAAAAEYEQLSALSDAELARRGLSRATLAEHVRAVAAAKDDSRSVNNSAARRIRLPEASLLNIGASQEVQM